MNQKTLEKLQANPHYKVSAKQYSAMSEEERPPMIEFGKVSNNQLPVTKHKTTITKVQRTRR